MLGNTVHTFSKYSTLIDLLRRQADSNAGQGYTFLLDGEIDEAKLTFTELDMQARAIAAQIDCCCKVGERALLLFPPGLEYITAFFGCLYAGIVAVPIYPPDPAQLNKTLPRLQTIIEDAQPSLALTTSSILTIAQAMLSSTPAFSEVNWLATDKLEVQDPRTWEAPKVEGESLAFLQYTSGSTAAPKGVMLTHNNLLHNSAVIYQAFGHSTKSQGVIWLPPYHDMGLIGGIIQPLYGGFPVTLMSPLSFLRKPIRWLQAISRYGATTSGGPNFAYDLCVRKVKPEELEELDLSSWEVAFNGAEPIRAETLKHFSETFGACGFRRESFFPCYGLAEATLIVSGDDKPSTPVVREFQKTALKQNQVVEASTEEVANRVLVSSGGNRFEQNVIIVDPYTQTRCWSEQIGEIWVSGPSVAKGYWNQPKLTSQTFNGCLRAGVKMPDGGFVQNPHKDFIDEPRFLRTGDLGFIRDSELFITGRLKDLIIIRGCNYYPQDIESTVEQCHPVLRPGYSTAFSINVDGEERLVVVQEIQRNRNDCDLESVIQIIRQKVVEHHELQVYDVVLVKAGSIPRTSSGKVQRHTCRYKYLESELEIITHSVLEMSDPSEVNTQAMSFVHKSLQIISGDKERKTFIELYLQDRAVQILRVSTDAVDINRSLVAAGFDSLTATELEHSVEADFEIELAAVELLQNSTISQLSERILGMIAAKAATTERESINTLDDMGNTRRPLELRPVQKHAELPLSSDQERLWILGQMAPERAIHNISIALRIQGQLDEEALEQSLNEVVRRHVALHTRIDVVDGKPFQQVAPALSLSLGKVLINDSEKSNNVEGTPGLQAQITEEINKPFDLSRSPLIRGTLFALGPYDYVFLIVAHHIISDIWSMSIITEEIFSFYNHFVNGTALSLPELAIQFADYVYWQHEVEQEESKEIQKAYWRKQLGDVPTMLNLPTDKPRPPIRGTNGATHFFTIPEHITNRLKEFSQEQGVTPYMTLLAAFKVLLYQLSGQEDIMVGSPVSGRSHPELASTVGFFAHPLVLRSRISSALTFQEFLSRVRTAALGAYAHQDISLTTIMELVQPERSSQNHPLFQVMFGYLDKLFNAIETSDLTVGPLNVDRGTSEFDLFLTLVRSQDGVQGILEYSSELWNADTIERFSESYCELLEQCISNPHEYISQFEIPHKLEETQVQQQEKFRIAIAATFTAEPVADSIEFWMQELGISAELEFAPYNQVFQQLLDEASVLSQNQNGLNVLLIRPEDWLRYHEAEAEVGLSEDLQSQLQINADEFIRVIKATKEKTSTSYLMCMCPASLSSSPFPSPAIDIIDQIEERVVTKLEEVNGVYVITSSELFSYYPVENYYDPYTDETGRIPFTSLLYTALGTMIARRIHAIQRAPCKVIVLDCDDTLWKGVCSEDGVSGIEIDESRRKLQDFMVKQHDAGMLLCLCSKNNENDVFNVFDRRDDMPLKRECFVSWRINWQPKSENIKSLADELQLGLDSFILVDDNPIECAEVQSNCPEVLTLCLPANIGDTPLFLNHIWAFDSVASTEEDKLRTLLYQQNIKRQTFEKESFSFEEFINGLDLEIQIDKVAPNQIERVSQLTYRTNQFNSTTIRRSVQEIQKGLQSSEFECYVVSLRDRFGDYGLVGAMLLAQEGEALVVDSFLLSCRALGKRVEHQMLSKLGYLAQDSALDTVELKFRATQKNRPILNFFDRVGAKCKIQREDHDIYRLPYSLAIQQADLDSPVDQACLEQKGKELETSTPAITSVAPAVHTKKHKYERIATDLNGAPRILEEIISSRVVKRSGLEIVYVAPTTSTEQELTQIWSEFLKVEPIGIHDNFFELGGHSLLATQIFSRVQESFHVDLPLDILFENDLTIERLAIQIEQHIIEQADVDDIESILSELDGLTDAEVKELVTEDFLVANYEERQVVQVNEK